MKFKTVNFFRLLAPERRSEMAKVGFRAMFGGLLAAYMTPSLAGFLL